GTIERSCRPWCDLQQLGRRCYYTSLRMAQRKARTDPAYLLSPQLAGALGVRRSARLRGVMHLTGLPPEAWLDLALEILDISSRKLSPPPIRRTALGLGAARWRNVSPEERSRILRQVVQARWAKNRRRGGR